MCIRDSSDHLKAFLTTSLQVSCGDITCLGIKWVERTRIPPRSKIRDEIRITFSNQALRDEFARKGRLLADCVDETGASTAGFRMDIPDFLATDFKTLNDYGFFMRRTHGKTTRKYVKYDDDGCSLFLELKLPRVANYLRISLDLARSLVAEGERVEIDRHRKDLLARPQLQQDTLSSSNLVPLALGQEKPSPTRQPSARAGVVTANLLRLAGSNPQDHGSSAEWRPRPTQDMSDIEY